jgi:hypothetical protein
LRVKCRPGSPGRGCEMRVAAAERLGGGALGSGLGACVSRYLREGEGADGCGITRSH